MSEEKLPQFINPLRLAEQSVQLTGYVSTKGMQRLSELTFERSERAHVSLQFSLNELNKPIATGMIQLSTKLICQRCLQPLAFDLCAAINWAFARNDQEAKQLQGHYDPILACEAKLALPELVEDEVILDLPMIALHEDLSLCSVQHEEFVSADTQLSNSSPFAELAKLKVKRKSTKD